MCSLSYDDIPTPLRVVIVLNFFFFVPRNKRVIRSTIVLTISRINSFHFLKLFSHVVIHLVSLWTSHVKQFWSTTSSKFGRRRQVIVFLGADDHHSFIVVPLNMSILLCFCLIPLLLENAPMNIKDSISDKC